MQSVEPVSAASVAKSLVLVEKKLVLALETCALLARFLLMTELALAGQVSAFVSGSLALTGFSSTA